jgi:hypothetical protein
MSQFDVFLADCPARTTLALVGDSWSVVVIMALGERPRRYGELIERIGGISIWQQSAAYGGRPLVVPIAGDEAAKQVVATLVRDTGAEPVDAGGIEHAGYLEAMAAVIIRLLYRGAHPFSAFQLTAGTLRAAWP